MPSGIYDWDSRARLWRRTQCGEVGYIHTPDIPESGERGLATDVRCDQHSPPFTPILRYRYLLCSSCAAIANVRRFTEIVPPLPLFTGRSHWKTMGLGVLEPNTTAHVPGTVLLDQQAAHSEQQTGRLKHGTGKNANIVLAPQPSEDPNDPLNWSPVKKNLVLAVIFFGVIVHGVVPVRALALQVLPLSS